MKNKVIFRDFEDKDVDFVYNTKNNKDFFNLSIGESNTLTYNDAVSWVQGCKNSDDSFKYWAVCTDDLEKRIIGWCGIANIDYRNKSAYFQTIVINDKNYKSIIVAYQIEMFIMHYVFEVLKLNRLYGSFLSENEWQEKVTQIIFNTIEGVMKQAVYKNGTFHDLTLTAVLKKEYFEHKNNGDFEMQNILKILMPENSAGIESEGIDSFLDFIYSRLEETKRTDINPQTKFRNLDEWSSLTALMIISSINEKYRVALNEDELFSSETFQDVYNIIQSKL